MKLTGSQRLGFVILLVAFAMYVFLRAR